jgi:hypothetical protein
MHWIKKGSTFIDPIFIDPILFGIHCIVNQMYLTAMYY